MRTGLLSVHILMGAIAIITGFIALYAIKGGVLHRKTGKVFVYAMFAMGILGASISAVWGVARQSNIPAGLLAAYLVVTALTTVRPRTEWSRRIDFGLMVLVFGLAAVNLTVAVGILNSANAKIHWLAIPLSIFASVAIIAGAGDIRVMRGAPLKGNARLARHLWRMCFALFVATGSFFLGQMKVMPIWMRVPSVLSIPVLMVLVTMVYWLWRMRRKPMVFDSPIASASNRLRNSDGFA